MTDANVCTANLEILVHVHMHTNHFYIEVEISRFCQETKKQLRKHTHTHTHLDTLPTMELRPSAPPLMKTGFKVRDPKVVA